MEPLVSICMPCHNADKYVGEAIESVLGQTYKNIELIVVNDGSTDRSREVLGRYEGRGVKVITTKNRGQCAAANQALTKAKGQYIKFFDADDILSSGFIETQIKRLAGRKDAVASARWGRFYNDDLKSFRLNPERVWQDMESTEWLVQALMNAQPMQQCGLWMIPRTVLEIAGGWNESLSLINDFEFFCRILCSVEEVLFCEESILYYRSGNKGSLSAQKSRKARESECESILLGTSHILERRSDPEARLACANMCQHLIYDLYPNHPDLRRKLHQRISECGAPNIKPSGGIYFQKLRPWIGWKLARRIQKMLRK